MSQYCAGIVLYNPDISRLNNNLTIISNQFDKIYMVDNHSAEIEKIRDLSAKYKKIELIENNHNKGIARALNQMCEKAKKDGYSWILTLDQDTSIPTNLMESFCHYTGDPQIGIICPAVYYEGLHKFRKNDNETEFVYACMTSASLTRLASWEAVGGFREDYFIDFVDNEFCMKLALCNKKVLRDNNVWIHHQLGESRAKRIFGKYEIRYTYHNPIRLYYMARNNYVFIREYRSHLSVLKEKLKLCYVLTNQIVFSENRKKAMWFVRRGITDAKAGKMGELIQ